MRKYRKILLLTVALIAFNNVPSFACDICGAGSGSYYMGILPEFNKRFLGLRYHYNTLETHLGPDGRRTPNTADETYQSVELWGTWNLGNRWRVMAIVPYNFNQRTVERAGEVGHKNGMGDVVVAGYFKLFEQVNETAASGDFVQSLWVGAGVKLPTGAYDDAFRTAVAQDAPNNFQLGTASTDLLLSAAYDMRLSEMGLNVNVNYKANTENAHEYRYGNKLTTSLLVYRQFSMGEQVRLAPNVGTLLDTQSKDVLYGKYDVAASGGHLWSGLLGLEMNFGKLSVGANYQLPIRQQLADGRAKAGGRSMVHLSYAL